jgi:hypothetical protein
MFKHLLIATDGSSASEKALAQGLLLSRMHEPEFGGDRPIARRMTIPTLF